jgi:hypothetical protein
MEFSCAIWGTPITTNRPITSDSAAVNSPRAGGWYQISRSAEAAFPPKVDGRWRAKLTTWLVNQRRAGVESPKLTSDIVSTIADTRALTYGDKVERLFTLLEHHQVNVGDNIDLSAELARGRTLQHDMLAWCECASDEELNRLLYLLSDDGLVSPEIQSVWSLTPKGFARLEEVSRRRPNTRNAFVAMWFSDGTKAAFEDGVAPALTEAGYTPVRVDRLQHSGKIDDEIIAQIRRARFVVADFTCGTVEADGKAHTIPRGGVYYEAGFAMGLDIPVIWMVRADQIGDVHFDTRQFPHITWTTPTDLREALYNRVAALIGVAPGAQDATSRPGAAAG